MKTSLAVFDFDGTLSRGTSGLRFIRYLLGTKNFYLTMLANSFWGLLFLTNKFNELALRKIVYSIFKDRAYEEVALIAEQYARDIMPQFYNQNIMQQLLWHQKQQHRILILTAALDIYMHPWAKQIGADQVIATELEIDAKGIFTGKLVGDYCFGKNKLRALSKLLADKDQYIIYAYCDSYEDRYVLAQADYPYWTRHPQSDLKQALLDPETHAKWRRKYGISSRTS